MAADNNDEFEDDLESFDAGPEDDEPQAEEGLSDEDWDSYDEQQSGDADQPDDQPQDPEPKKKSGNFNKILIGLAVVAGLGFLVLQMGKGAPSPAPAQQAAVQTPGVNPAPATPEAEPAGLLTSEQGIAQLQEDIAKRAASAPPIDVPPPAPVVPHLKEANDVPVPPMPTAMAAPEETPEQLPNPAAAVPAPAPEPASSVSGEPRMPNAQDIMLKKPEVPVAVQASAVEPVVPVPAPAVIDNSTALQETIDTLQARIATLEGNLKDLGDKTQKDQETIADLEKKLAAQDASPVAAAEPAPKPTPKILGAAAPDGMTEEPVKKPRSTPVASKASPARVSQAWILKGAQPGRAMVARSGESDIRTVEVGDSLSGIGKITAIIYEGGRWSVQGTQGRINQ